MYADGDGDGYGSAGVVIGCPGTDGLVSNSADCNDAVASINPGATEVCDASNTDEDCDGTADDADTSVASVGKSTFYADADSDGYGGSTSGSYCDLPTGYVPTSTDCVDTNAVIHPGATDTDADGTDADCSATESCYQDVDGDAYRTTTLTSYAVTAGATGACSTSGRASSSVAATDCNDSVAAINPGANEICDSGNTDEDCDGLADDANSSVVSSGKTMFYADADADGYGGATTAAYCDLPTGYVATSTDCVDTNASIHPGATDTAADGTDSDCSGTESCYQDADGDAYRTMSLTSYTVTAGATGVCSTAGRASASVEASDCNDAVAAINTGATEICDASNTDEDCDGLADDADTSVASSGKTTFYADADADGYGGATTAAYCDLPSGYVATSTDCVDTNASIYPRATDTAADGTDSDCSGTESCYQDADGDAYRTTTLTSFTVTAGATDACSTSGRASASVAATDCNDAVATINPGATEVCDASNTDEDCDGLADDADVSVASSGKTTFYADADADGYGGATTGAYCDLPTGYVATSTDCVDTNAAIHPGATDTAADGTDSDCSGTESCYQDADGDAYRTTTLTSYTVTAGATGACGTAGRASASVAASDCNDAVAAINPSATEVCDSANTDENCDGLADDADSSVVSAGKTTFYADADSDGYGGATTGAYCDLPSGYVATSTDCVDTNAAIHPGATDTAADGTDSDCSGTESCYQDADGDAYRTTTLTSNTVTAGATGACSTAGRAASSVAATDCNDAVAAIHPGATEVCDSANTDEDCDGLADDADASVASSSRSSFYADADADGYGGTTTGAYCDLQTGYVATATDCVDTNAAIHPGATETTGDGVDANCDGAESCYQDLDGDGARTAFVVASADTDCADAGEAPAAAEVDCDDADATALPSATELPGTDVDEDCDGGEWCYVDADGDGYRPDATSLVASADSDCDDPGEARVTALVGDCDDHDARFHPGASESDCADASDYNCDGSTIYADGDGDGWAACAECDDADASAHPGATELPGDHRDSDCDGTDTCYVDADGDGVRAEPLAVVSGVGVACDAAGEATTDDATGDCDDAAGDVHPGATELLGDGVDADCDALEACYADADGDGARSDVVVASADLACAAAGLTDVLAPMDCDDADAGAAPGVAEIAGDGIDQDCDGRDLCYADADGDGFRSDATVAGRTLDCSGPGESAADVTGGDLDDTDPGVHPGAVEIVGDGIDQDCDGTELCWVDADDDSYTRDDGATVVSADLACDGPGEASASALPGDCDDTDPAFHPHAAETDCADPADYNCDGSTGFADEDGDGVAACADCDDADAGVRPGAVEVAGDGVDADCDGTEDCYVDADADGFRDAAGTLVASADPACATSGLARTDFPAGDCDDADAGVNPGALETPGDGVDADCDGTEDCYVDVDGDGVRADDTTVRSPNLACDGVGEATATAPTGDCDDASSLRYPGSPETDCLDPVDYNCDGASGRVDGDADGFAACEECDDASGAVNPDAAEVCDGRDNDCEGAVDNDAIDAVTWYADLDGDGFTDTDSTVAACAAPVDYVAVTSDAPDCDDTDAARNPDAQDIPDDGIDQDCDGTDAASVVDTGGDTGPHTGGGVEDTSSDKGVSDANDEGKSGGCGCESRGGARDVAPLLALTWGLVLAWQRRRASLPRPRRAA